MPFALSAGLVTASDGWHVFRLFNTNTEIFVDVGLNVVDGQEEVDGRAGATPRQRHRCPDRTHVSGSRRKPHFRTPAIGSRAGGFDVDGLGFEATLVDATLPLVIVPATLVSLNGTESPDAIDAKAHSMIHIEELRRKAAMRMGLCESPETAPQVVPKAAVVSVPEPTMLLDGTELPAADVHLLVRVISMGQAHQAVPGTAATCLVVVSLLPDAIRSCGGSSSGTIPTGPAPRCGSAPHRAWSRRRSCGTRCLRP